MSRIIAIILLILVLGGAVALGVIYFRSSPKVVTITITKDAKFSPTELKASNSEVVKIKNEDSKKHTVRNLNNNTNIVSDLEAGKTSGEIVFDDNSRNQIALVDNKDVTASILVGNAPAAPQVEQKPVTTQKTTATQTLPTTTTPAQTQKTQPLPSTGPRDLYFYPLALLAGIVVLFLTRQLGLVSLPRYRVLEVSKAFFVTHKETLLVTFPLKKTDPS